MQILPTAFREDLDPRLQFRDYFFANSPMQSIASDSSIVRWFVRFL